MLRPGMHPLTYRYIKGRDLIDLTMEIVRDSSELEVFFLSLSISLPRKQRNVLYRYNDDDVIDDTESHIFAQCDLHGAIPMHCSCKVANSQGI